jgi:hypothetical protein
MALATPLAGIASNHAAMSIITPDDEQNRGALGKCPVFCVGMSRKETHVHDNQKRFGRAP